MKAKLILFCLLISLCASINLQKMKEKEKNPANEGLWGEKCYKMDGLNDLECQQASLTSTLKCLPVTDIGSDEPTGEESDFLRCRQDKTIEENRHCKFFEECANSYDCIGGKCTKPNQQIELGKPCNGKIENADAYCKFGARCLPTETEKDQVYGFYRCRFENQKFGDSCAFLDDCKNLECEDGRCQKVYYKQGEECNGHQKLLNSYNQCIKSNKVIEPNLKCRLTNKKGKKGNYWCRYENYLKVGEACDFHEECKDGLKCKSSFIGKGECKKIKSKIKYGEKCDGTIPEGRRDLQCVTGLFCLKTFDHGDPGTFVCRNKDNSLKLHQECKYYDECEGFKCKKSDKKDVKTCQKLKYEKECSNIEKNFHFSCDDNLQCLETDIGGKKKFVCRAPNRSIESYKGGPKITKCAYDIECKTSECFEYYENGVNKGKTCAIKKKFPYGGDCNGKYLGDDLHDQCMDINIDDKKIHLKLYCLNTLGTKKIIGMRKSSDFRCRQQDSSVDEFSANNICRYDDECSAGYNCERGGTLVGINIGKCMPVEENKGLRGDRCNKGSKCNSGFECLETKGVRTFKRHFKTQYRCRSKNLKIKEECKYYDECEEGLNCNLVSRIPGMTPDENNPQKRICYWSQETENCTATSIDEDVEGIVCKKGLLCIYGVCRTDTMTPDEIMEERLKEKNLVKVELSNKKVYYVPKNFFDANTRKYVEQYIKENNVEMTEKEKKRYLNEKILKENIKGRGRSPISEKVLNARPSFCWKTEFFTAAKIARLPIGFHTGDNPFKFFGDCLPGYKGDGIFCIKVKKDTSPLAVQNSYERGVLNKLSKEVECERGYKHMGPFCYRDCAILGMTNCLVNACSRNGVTCGIELVGMVYKVFQGVFKFSKFIMTLGSSSILDVVKGVAEKIEEEFSESPVGVVTGKIGEYFKTSTDKLVDKIATDAKDAMSYMFEKSLYEAVNRGAEKILEKGQGSDNAKIRKLSGFLRAFVNGKDDDAEFGETMESFVESATSLGDGVDFSKLLELDSDHIVEIAESINANPEPIKEMKGKKDGITPAKIGKSICKIMGFQKVHVACLEEGHNRECIKAILEHVEDFDPTGILIIVGAFIKPQCRIPMYRDPQVDDFMF